VERQVDDGGFSSFFGEAYPRLVGQLRLLTGDLASAEDVAQEAFVRAASRWRQLARYDQPEAWVRKTAFRLAIDLLRRAARHRGLLTRLGAGQQEAVELAPEDRGVVAALGALPLPLREVLVLHHCVDLPVEAVAAQLGVNVGTVKSRLYRGRERLVALLREQAPPDSSNPAAEQVAEEERHAQP
jgi:RNA polymerase sigma-70 factor (ECF subfamily)